jgi:hypothetical protein
MKLSNAFSNALKKSNPIYGGEKERQILQKMKKTHQNLGGGRQALQNPSEKLSLGVLNLEGNIEALKSFNTKGNWYRTLHKIT